MKQILSRHVVYLLFLFGHLVAQNNNYGPLQFGEFKIIPIHVANITTKLSKAKSTTESINVFLIQTHGVNYLIDAGIDNTWNNLKSIKRKLFFNKFKITNINNLEDVLKIYKLTTDSINFVILSHAHFDHIYNLDKFKNAKIILSQREYTSYKKGLIMGYFPMKKSVLRNSLKVNFIKDTVSYLFEKSFTITPNFKIVPTFGHTRGHSSILLISNNNYILFSGDANFISYSFSQKQIELLRLNRDLRIFKNHTLIE